MRIEPKEIRRGSRYCDLCRRPSALIRECRLPYPAGSRCRWYDLCDCCITAIQALPQEYADLDTSFGWMSQQPVLTLQGPVRASERRERRGKKGTR